MKPGCLTIDAAINAVALPGMLIGHRQILDGDEKALFPEEIRGISPALRSRRASGAARIVARKLLTQIGMSSFPLVKDASGAPVWPQGVVGSLAHDDAWAVAVVAKSDRFVGLGIDIEPADPLPQDLDDIIATASELSKFANNPYASRLLFAIKEAVYKATHPLDHIFLDHHDVEVDLESLSAVLRNGRTVPFRFEICGHILALAFVPRNSR